MYKICDKSKNLKIYEPPDVLNKINMSANESFFSIEDKNIEEIKKAVDSLKFNRYPDILANNLIEKFSKFINTDKALITAGAGSDELINLILETFLNKGEKIVILNPDFSMYAHYAKLLEIEILDFNKDKNLKINFKALAECVNKNKAAAVIFSNPCNPTSLVENREDLINFIESVNSLIIVDEAYMEFSGQSILSEVGRFDNLIILKTLSKAISLAGVRLGFAVTSKTLTNVLRAAKSPYNVNCLSAKVGEIVLENSNYIKSCVKSLIDSRDFLLNEIKKFKKIFNEDFKIYESAANFIYIETIKAKKIDTYLKSKNIAVRYFDNALRITGGNPQENLSLISALKEISK